MALVPEMDLIADWMASGLMEVDDDDGLRQQSLWCFSRNTRAQADFTHGDLD